MQAHLATRLGKWQKTSDRSSKALELELDYHKAMSVKPAEDHQFAHHVQTLLLSLTHDGRFQQAQKLDNTRPDKNKPSIAWFRLQLARHDWNAAETEARRFLKTDKATAYYLLTVLELQKDNTAGALPFLESMQQLWASSKKDKQLEYRIWEIQGRWLCQQGSLEAGLKLLRKAVERSKNDYSHHSWGNGSYFMEIWGLEALRGQKYDEAEEAFLEALAHDPGSTRAALGMKLLCEQNGRTAEAGDYFKLAKKSWAKADDGVLEKELESIRIYTLKSTPSQ
jgi:tetratricopeptide (TPR) repeat protein